MRFLLLCLVLIPLAGCSWTRDQMARLGDSFGKLNPFPESRQSDREHDQPLIGDLQPATLEHDRRDVREVEVDELIEAYTRLARFSDDPVVRLHALERLGDLRLEKGETDLYASGSATFDPATEAYESLLEEFPDAENRDRVLYQLARTFDLQGDTERNLKALNALVLEHEGSPYLGEAQFRRGEMLFNAEDYGAARDAFESVIALGESQFLVNAHYMKGWTLFKQSQYESALESFVEVLDLVLPADLATASIKAENETLVEDLLRVMGIGFNYLGGAEAVPELFGRIGDRPWAWLIYSRYASLLRSQELYTDAIEVYRTYLTQYPLGLQAPEFQVSIIDTMIEAGFASSILEEKARFVANYGMDSAYWEATNPVDLEFTEKVLEEYLPELAAVRFSFGEIAAREARGKPAEDFRQAAAYYADFARTFPQSVETPQMLRLQGESLARAGNWPESIVPWERAGYDYPSYAERVEAAYASLTALDQVIEGIGKGDFVGQIPPPVGQLPTDAVAPVSGGGGATTGEGEDAASSGAAEESTDVAEQSAVDPVETQPEQPVATSVPAQLSVVEQWRARRYASRLRFVDTFEKDPRAPDILMAAASEQFSAERYQDVVQLSMRLLGWRTPLEPSRRVDAQLLVAHAWFGLEGWKQAEAAYLIARESLPEGDARRDKVDENLAASIYKQGEQLLASGQKSEAVDELLRISNVAPDARLRMNAEFDAGNTLLELERWEEAIEVLERFRQRYPDQELAATIPGKLALAYRQTEQWGLAAAEVAKMQAQASNEEDRRTQGLIIAELYDQAGDSKAAIDAYRNYANTWSSPVEEYMEAAYRLGELYAQAGDDGKRDFWLRKQLEAFDRAPDPNDPRLRYIAASAASALAEKSYRAFTSTQLTLPLKASLGQKTAAMKEAMGAYKRMSELGIAEFATEAGYRTGEIYRQFSRALFDSERPDNLDALQLEQYELLLEEQAYPFEENAIVLHEQNVQRAWTGLYDQWVRKSFDALAELLPARYLKPEKVGDTGNGIE